MIVEFMGEVVEAVEDCADFFYQCIIKPIAVFILKAIIIVSFPVWVIPYKVIRKYGKK